MSEIRIIQWEDRLAQAFIDLSVEWLEKYVSVEPADLEILNHPHEAILDRGGMVFFAMDGEAPVGTVAMIPAANDDMELAKLAVTEAYKGMGISHMLMRAALAYAQEREVRQIILYTNRKLIPAIRLYEKYGFLDVPLKYNKYLESDMMMSKRLAD